MATKWSKRNSLGIILFLVVGLTNLVRAQNGLGKVDSILHGYLNKGEFMGTVLVARNDSILLKKGYGYSDIDKGIPNDLNTKFPIGSLTKSFVACAIMQQVETGKLDLSTRIGNYIPELEKEIGNLTLHYLLKNSSGLPVHLNRITDLQYRDISSQELLDIINRASLSMKPGSGYSYSNLNYQLASLILERVTGISYENYMSENVFRKLDMNNTGIEKTRSIPSGRATGYINDDHYEAADRNYMGYAKGSGDMYSTVGDLYFWDRALYKNTFLTKESIELMFDGNPDAFGGYGYGFKVKEYKRNSCTKPTGKLVRHGGSMYGFVCNVHRYLDDNLTIIILGNIRPFPIMQITTEIEKSLLGT
ncbi:serine hydrolase domain-containing protein [Flagellimonas allohymeniacidonis]|nr:serine hydrolase domain-containing protein [Allomuricauda hymeniacidonis]